MDGPAPRTLRDSIDRLDHIAAMEFDVVYLPPIHPIGTTKRKGRNNSLEPTSHDPGSPWAIGGADGGHTAIHRELGTYDEFVDVVATARTVGSSGWINACPASVRKTSIFACESRL